MCVSFAFPCLIVITSTFKSFQNTAGHNNNLYTSPVPDVPFQLLIVVISLLALQRTWADSLNFPKEERF